MLSLGAEFAYLWLTPPRRETVAKVSSCCGLEIAIDTAIVAAE